MNSAMDLSSGPAEFRFRLLAIGQIALMGVTWPLWTPQTNFPRVPLISLARRVPVSLEWGLVAVLVLSLAVPVFAKRPVLQRVVSLLTGLCTFGLVLIDQHRLQPWAWQFIILSVVLTVARPLVALAAWRWLVIGIYAWSAWSKCDHSFCKEHGPFLLDGLCHSIGLTKGTQNWPANVRYVAAAAIPIIEFLIAAGLVYKRTQRMSAIAAAIMHVGLLLALGPLGHGHQPGVLIWNLFFLVQNWFLFLRSPVLRTPALSRSEDHATSQAARLGDFAACLTVAAAMAWPLLEPFGFCDHWPAWAVYAARPERVRVMIDESDVVKMPENLRQHLAGPDFDGWYLFRIDRWSLDALYAPIYPQDRFQVGVALWLAHEFDLQQMRVVIQGPADRWTGKRSEHQHVGVCSIEQLASDYRLNAFP